MSISSIAGPEPEKPKEEQVEAPKDLFLETVAPTTPSPTPSTAKPEETPSVQSTNSSVTLSAATPQSSDDPKEQAGDTATPSGSATEESTVSSNEPLSSSLASTPPKEEQEVNPLVTPVPSLASVPSPSDNAGTPLVQPLVPVVATPAPVVSAHFDAITDALLSKVGDPGASSNFKIMVYSEPGAFKTSWLRTAPGNLVCDLEDGAIAMASAAIATGEPIAPGVKVIPIKSFEGAEWLLERIENNVPGFDKETYPVFSIDTSSELHKKGIEDVKKQQALLRPATNLYKIETDDHSENNQRIQSFVRRLRDLDRDIILTSHARTVEAKGKPAKTYPDFSESMANKIEAMMDIVAFITVVEDDEGKFHQIFRVMPGAGIHAKTRIPLPSAEIMDPTWPQLKEIYLNTKAKAEEMAKALS